MKNSAIFAKYDPKPENMIAILHDIQDSNPRQFLSSEDLKETAEFLNTTLAHVYGVAGYYSMFAMRPRGKKLVRVCVSPVCSSLGSAGILEAFREKLSLIPGQATPGGEISLETCQCLGRCGKAPSMMVNKTIYTNVDGDKLQQILDTTV